jgi:hypothetical protein
MFFFFRSRLGGPKLELPKNLGSFRLLDPDFFFVLGLAGQHKRQCSDLFFGVVFMTLFFFFNFFNLRVVSVGAFSELKIPEPGAKVRKCPTPGLL